MILLETLLIMVVVVGKALIGKNTKYFNTAATLKCEGGDKNNYLISKATGWSVTATYYFLKESLLVRADKCKRVGENK